MAPNSTENVSILLVDRDKQILLHSYDRLGQSALDHSKDKFLVQCCGVEPAFAARYARERAAAAAAAGSGSGGGGPDGARSTAGMSKEMTDQLTAMWSSATAGGAPIHNKKLHVRHVVDPAGEGRGGGFGAGAGAAGGGAIPSAPAAGMASGIEGASSAPPLASLASPGPRFSASDKTPADSMSPEQMFAEITTLRRKYDELVSFSVNLTAERDILNNTLEQTKRDLNREMAARAALENSGGGGGRGGGSGGSGRGGGQGGGFGLRTVLVLAAVCALAGIRAANSGGADFLGRVPVLGPLLEAGGTSGGASGEGATPERAALQDDGEGGPVPDEL